jgi:pyruvate/2-oxoglutarate dehydrogenase complex dihydrolipoamide dehydrogenase (E3) component
LKSKVVGGYGGPKGCKVEYENIDTHEKSAIESDCIMVATGRRAFTDGL